MSIRRTFNFNTQDSTRNDGIYLNQSCDIHGETSSTHQTPFLLDVSFNNRAEIGDYPTYKPSSTSLPTRIVGGIEGRIRIATADTNATIDDCNILVNSTAGIFTVQLPAISTVPGKLLFIKCIGTANSALVTRAGADTIDGAVTLQLEPGASVFYFADSVSNVWRAASRSSKMTQLVRENPVSPTRTTVSGSGTVLATSGNVYFSGRPVLLTCQVNARDDKAAPEEYFKITYTARFDGGGTEYVLGYINGGNAGTHINGMFQRIINPGPAAGIHTVDFLWARSAGTGTMTMDNNDMFQLNCYELN